MSGSQPTFYIDDLRLIGNPTPPITSATVRIQPNGPAIPLDYRVRGTNLATWSGPDRLNNATFRARTIASGVTVIRLPGGSWSNTFDWRNCEVNGGGVCAWSAKPTDFLNFLKATNTEGQWGVSPNGTPQEAAALVAFFNLHHIDSVKHRSHRVALQFVSAAGAPVGHAWSVTGWNAGNVTLKA